MKIFMVIENPHDFGCFKQTGIYWKDAKQHSESRGDPNKQGQAAEVGQPE